MRHSTNQTGGVSGCLFPAILLGALIWTVTRSPGLALFTALALAGIVTLISLAQQDRAGEARRRYREERRQSLRSEYQKYLQSDAWKRKRYVVLRRDNWTCRICGAKATEVHHMKYLRSHREPIEWLISVCSPCHSRLNEGNPGDRRPIA